ncbi:hypothetical protein BKA65DRAFT_579331, partial [Rhexocercosporidium sp. MPI-PUGE-AT-0058]
YDSDDIGLHNSPLLKSVRPNLRPSPSPPPPFSLPQVTLEPTLRPPGRKGSNRSRNGLRDAVLVSFMGGGRRPNIARKAGNEPLALDNEDAKDSIKENEDTVEKDSINLTALAADALRAHKAKTAQGTSQPAHTTSVIKSSTPNADAHPAIKDEMEDVKSTNIPSITASYVDDSHSRSLSASTVKPKIKASPAYQLPPIRQHSPKSGVSNGKGVRPITLPSISLLRDLNDLAKAAATSDSAFPQSPSRRTPPRFSAAPVPGTPSKSPVNAFRRELPSSGRGSITKTPSTDKSGSPPTIVIDRMSIDGITNSGFQCSYPGCTTRPFLTKFLLNSHANVHSSNRPYYCSVKGCPRGKSEKGFKRNNKKIRHGLIHSSPGYVCPFYLDREHKYPRPDNLQRHVRAQHANKGSDDPQLRRVLSQKLEGSSKSRRKALPLP